jgi:uncharacterized protein (TIGR03437 family)
LLPDGRVLVAGGAGDWGVVGTVDLYGASGAFTPGAPMLQARAGAACATLTDGRVLVAGGSDGTNALASAEIYDPSTGAWQSSGSMAVARTGAVATATPWGTVLITGGENSGVVELFLNGQFTTVGKLSAARQDYAIAVLPDRKVMIAGGTDGSSTLASIDLFDAATNRVAPAGTMLQPRKNFGAATLYDGTVLITGGYDAAGNVLSSAEIFDPAQDVSAAAPAMRSPRANHRAYTLPHNGRVLLVGGTDGTNLLTSSDSYVPFTGRFSLSGTMNVARRDAASSLLRRNALVVAGGRNSSGYVSASEVYAFSTIETDKANYQPGDSVTFTGAGWTPGERVAVQVTALPLDGRKAEFTGTATADGAGQITLSGFTLDKNHPSTKYLATAIGSQSLAQNPIPLAISNKVQPTVTVSTPSLTVTLAVPIAVTVTVTGPSGIPTGQVDLVDNNAGLLSGGFANLDATGAHTFTYTPPTLGQHTLAADYTGDSVYAPGFPGSTAPNPITINVVAATTIAATFPPSVTYGGTLTIPVTVTSLSPGTPTGTVTFTSGTVILGTITLSGLPAAGTLSISETALSASGVAYPITATYNGDSNFAASSTSGNVLVTRATTTTALTTSGSPSGPSTPVTFTATVAPAGAGVPTGTVSFYNGSAIPANLLGTVALSGGIAAFQTSSLPIGGPYTIRAVYSGDVNFLTSNGTVAQSVSKASTTTTVVGTTNVIVGRTASFTAQVTSSPSTITPGGTVSFTLGGTPVAGCQNLPLVNGLATCSTSFGQGSFVLTATYSGDANTGTSSGSLNLNVQNGQNGVTLDVTTTPNPLYLGQAVTFSATVSATSGNGPNPTGTVQFFDGTTLLGTGTLSQGRTTFTVVLQGAGNHGITATYSGDGTYGGTSVFFGVYVAKLTAAISLVSTAATSVFGQAVTFTATVSAQLPPGITAPTGQVEFLDGLFPIGTVSLSSSGVATLTISNLVVGTHQITAVYLGDGNWTTSKSTAVALVVNKAVTLALVAAATASQGSVQVTLSAAISVVLPGGGTPTGTVQFVDTRSNNVLGTAILAGGTASITIQVGQLVTNASAPLITAVYSGDSNFASSASLPLIQVVNAASYIASNQAPEAIATIFGSGLAAAPLGATTTPVPTILGGTSVQITDSAGVIHAALLFYVSSTQVNLQIPPGTAAGTANLAVTSTLGTFTTVIRVAPSAGGLFAANANGKGVAAAQLVDVHPDGSQSVANVAQPGPDGTTMVAVPVNIVSTDQYFLVLYGTGLRFANSVTCTINGQAVNVTFAGAQPSFLGLDQVNVAIPPSLKGAGQVNIVLNVDGEASNTVTVTFQ